MNRTPSSPDPFPSALDPAVLVISHVRGPMTRQVRDTVHREGGEAAWQALLARVSPECRAAFSQEIGLYEWIEARHSAELSLAYLAQAVRDLSFTQRRSEEAAQELLTTLNRWLLRMLSPSFLLSSFPRLYNLYYRGGKVTVDAIGESQAQLSLWAEGFYPAWYAQGLPAFLRAALAAAGADQISVDYRPPSGEGLLAFRHQYEVRWK